MRIYSLLLSVLVMIGLISNCGCIDTFLNSSSQTNTKSVMHNVKEEEAKPLIIGYSLSSPIIINPSQKFPYSDLARKYSVSKIKYLEVKKENQTICYNYIYEFFNEDTLSKFYYDISNECNAQSFYILGEPCKKGVYFNHTVYIVGLEGGSISKEGKKQTFIHQKNIMILSIKEENVSDGEFYKGTSYLNVILRKSMIAKYGTYKLVDSGSLKQEISNILEFYNTILND